MIYIAKLTKEDFSFLKLGYTKHQTTDKRFIPYRKVFDKVELLKTYKQERDLKSLEKYLNQYELVDYKLDTGINFGGKNECYSTDLYQFITDKIESILYSSKFDDKESNALVNYLEDKDKMCETVQLFGYRGREHKECIDITKPIEDISIIKHLFEIHDKIGDILKEYDRDVVEHNCNVWEGILHDTSGKRLVCVDAEEIERLEKLEQDLDYYEHLLK